MCEGRTQLQTLSWGVLDVYVSFRLGLWAQSSFRLRKWEGKKSIYLMIAYPGIIGIHNKRYY